MKIFKILSVLFISFAALNLTAQHDSLKKNALVWHTDIIKANEIAKASNKPLFAFFTGSDWCGWCKKLQHDVFSKPEFIQWATNNVTLVEVDFPRGKQLTPELQKQNQSLQQTFQVTGYPTIWMFFLNKSEDGSRYDIESFGSLGYPAGAVQGQEQIKFLETANQILKKNAPKK